jgi:antitoxin component YwqK of YwqJK toxin-antitoxin module
MQAFITKLYMITLLTIFILNTTAGQSFQIYSGDTINKVDENNLKQGKWIYFGNMKNDPAYKAEQKVEEGQYADSRKQGMWKKYFPNEKTESEINYENNRPSGEYKIYFENGQLQEHGFWKNNRNIGNFTRYYENGNVSQKFEFNPTGKRDGNQTYFHENGQKMIEGNWAGGKEAGEVKEWYENGDIKSVKVYNDGAIDVEKTQTFEPKKPIEKKEEIEVVDPNKIAKVEKDATLNQTKDPFTGNGEATLYNRNKQISQKGFFKNYRLIDGEWYRYDENGILMRIEKYKNGKYVGDAPIEEDKQ